MIPLVGWRPPDCRGEFSTYFPRDVCLCCTIHLCGESQLPCSLQYHRNSALGPNWTHFLERFSVILLFWALGIMMQSYCSCIWQWNRPVRVLFLVWVRPIHFLAAGLTFGFWSAHRETGFTWKGSVFKTFGSFFVGFWNNGQLLFFSFYSRGMRIANSSHV